MDSKILRKDKLSEMRINIKNSIKDNVDNNINEISGMYKLNILLENISISIPYLSDLDKNGLIAFKEIINININNANLEAIPEINSTRSKSVDINNRCLLHNYNINANDIKITS